MQYGFSPAVLLRHGEPVAGCPSQRTRGGLCARALRHAPLSTSLGLPLRVNCCFCTALYFTTRNLDLPLRVNSAQVNIGAGQNNNKFYVIQGLNANGSVPFREEFSSARHPRLPPSIATPPSPMHAAPMRHQCGTNASPVPIRRHLLFSGTYYLYTRYGRVGEPGKTGLKGCGNEAACVTLCVCVRSRRVAFLGSEWVPAGCCW